MSWRLISADGICKIELNVADSVLSGTIELDGAEYNVSGAWSAASGLIPGRNYSTFSFSGVYQSAIPVWISASGIMTGPGDAPIRIDIEADVADSNTAELFHYSEKLFPF